MPATIDGAVDKVKKAVAALRELGELLPADDWPVRVAVDTNMLLDDPDVAVYTSVLGRRYMVHLLPVVLRELDDKKLSGRTPDLREAAKKADRRLKGLRTNGNVLRGVKVAGDVHAVFEHIEPRATSCRTGSTWMCPTTVSWPPRCCCSPDIPAPRSTWPPGTSTSRRSSPQ
ncbi:hypothetical protein J4032_17855 [Streptomyces formicae]|uniref:PIN domain-containing protein n=1 Tax=Streptomyces formicae TaxID=1616117 RepID=A0ABY3WKH2_9ACTN|nr:PIN domain-containing protein [Streptomyces formicae]UNM13109.1 hypothetical protein J4032_17855 [Streptomyces formicae]